MRPIGPLTLATQPTSGPPVPLDIYLANPQLASLVVDEAALGTLTYVAEYAFQNPYAATFAASGIWQTLGAGAAVGTTRTFNMPAGTAVTAVRIRTTGGAGVATYWVTQTGS